MSAKKTAELQWEPQVAQSATVTIPIASLHWADSPRLEGENGDHVRVLAESSDSLPPILVHRPTMRVIDGMHRLRAALLRGEETIAARFFDCEENDIFVVAVQANTVHGLPLSLTDRKRAAERIIGSHPHWSDRLVASTAGLSHKTVAAIRRRATGDCLQSHSRTGRDGRVRPLSGAEGRQTAVVLLRENPGASLREIAKAAGISPGTVRDVRTRLERCEDPVVSGDGSSSAGMVVGEVNWQPDGPAEPLGQANPAGPAINGEGRPSPNESADHRNRDAIALSRPRTADPTAILRRLMKDPALRFSESGRCILRRLYVCTIGVTEFVEAAETVPPHSAIAISKLARANAAQWKRLARQFEDRARGDIAGSSKAAEQPSAQ